MSTPYVSLQPGEGLGRFTFRTSRFVSVCMYHLLSFLDQTVDLVELCVCFPRHMLCTSIEVQCSGECRTTVMYMLMLFVICLCCIAVPGVAANTLRLW